MSCTQNQSAVLICSLQVLKANSAESLPSFLQMPGQSPGFGSDHPLHQSPLLQPPMDLPMNYTSFTPSKKTLVGNPGDDTKLFTETELLALP
jgi:hypothetical protein